MTTLAQREHLQRARACIGRATPAEREAKRQRLIETAARLHQEHGFGGFTVEQLAREAGTSVGAVYLYVPSIGAIYAELLRQDLAGLGHSVIAILKRYLPAELVAVVEEAGW